MRNHWGNADVAKVLLLEDDPDFLFTMTCALESEGHIVHGVATLKEAINFLRFQKPDLLILDYMISNQNSLRVADFALYANPDVPVIYITGSGMFTEGQLFNLAGNVSWVLRKPVKLRDLIEIVEYSLARDAQEPKQAHVG